MDDLFVMSEIIYGDSKKEKLKAAAKDFLLLLHEGYDINNEAIQDSVFLHNDINHLSKKEKSYIKKIIKNGQF